MPHARVATLIAPLHVSWTVCAACLLAGVAGGAYRQWCIQFRERMDLPAGGARGGKKLAKLPLEAYAPGWQSRQLRAGSWAVVAACSVAGAVWTTDLLMGFESGHGVVLCLCVLLVRWLLAAIIGTGAANYVLAKHGWGRT